MFKNFLLTMLIILPMAANAHSPLSSSSPQDGETLDVPPVEIIMDFNSPAKLIKVELKKSKNKQGSSFLGGLFGGDDGESVPLGESFLLSMNKRQKKALVFIANNPGLWLFHCHMLEHNAAGMGGVLSVS